MQHISTGKTFKTSQQQFIRHNNKPKFWLDDGIAKYYFTYPCIISFENKSTKVSSKLKSTYFKSRVKHITYLTYQGVFTISHNLSENTHLLIINGCVSF